MLSVSMIVLSSVLPKMSGSSVQPKMTASSCAVSLKSPTILCNLFLSLGDDWPPSIRNMSFSAAIASSRRGRTSSTSSGKASSYRRDLSVFGVASRPTLCQCCWAMCSPTSFGMERNEMFVQCCTAGKNTCAVLQAIPATPQPAFSNIGRQLMTISLAFCMFCFDSTKLGTGTETTTISGKSESPLMVMCAGALCTNSSSSCALACGPMPPIIPMADIYAPL